MAKILAQDAGSGGSVLDAGQYKPMPVAQRWMARAADDASTFDAGRPADWGATRTDAGSDDASVLADAGVAADAGVFDAGFTDAGPADASLDTGLLDAAQPGARRLAQLAFRRQAAESPAAR